MHGRHGKASVLPVKQNRQEARLTSEGLVDLVEPRLDHFELLTALLHFFLHTLCWVHTGEQVFLWGGLIEQLCLQKELRLQVVLFDIDLRAKLDDIPENYELLGVSDEKCLGIERVCVVPRVRLV